jgi:uncharacterized membrane protein (UPF0127 family)
MNLISYWNNDQNGRPKILAARTTRCAVARIAQEVAGSFPSLSLQSHITGDLPRAWASPRAPGQQVVRATRIVAAFALFLATTAPTPAQTNPNDQVGPMATVALHIDKATLTTKIAATPAQEERGLMFVTKMPDNDGMIFLLPLGRAEFWMKNTLIPLSVAFIDKNGVILEIHDMQPGDPAVPDSELPRTRSDSTQVQYALETNLHWFALNGIKPGDKLDPPPATLGKASAEVSDQFQNRGSSMINITTTTNAPPH